MPVVKYYNGTGQTEIAGNGQHVEGNKLTGTKIWQLKHSFFYNAHVIN